MRLSLRTLAVAALIGLGGATTASAQVSESFANRVGRWTGYGWSEGYHAFDECPPCRSPGHGFHHHHGGKASSAGWVDARHPTFPRPLAGSPLPVHLFQAPGGSLSSTNAVKAAPSQRRPTTITPPTPREATPQESVLPSTKAGPLPPPQPLPTGISPTTALQEQSQLARLPHVPQSVAKPVVTPSQRHGRYPLAP